MTVDQLGILRDAVHALGNLLAAEGAEEHLIVGGGVAMNLRGFAARATDVDLPRDSFRAHGE